MILRRSKQIYALSLRYILAHQSAQRLNKACQTLVSIAQNPASWILRERSTNQRRVVAVVGKRDPSWHHGHTNFFTQQQLNILQGNTPRSLCRAQTANRLYTITEPWARVMNAILDKTAGRS